MEMSMPASVFEQVTEHDVADGQEGGVEGHEQADPATDPGCAALREPFCRPGRRDDHRTHEWKNEDRQRGLPGAAAHGEQAEETAERTQSADAQDGGEREQEG